MKSDRARTFRPEACGKLLLLLTRLNGSSVFPGLPPFAATTTIEKIVGTSWRHGKRGVLRARELRRATIRTKERLATTSISFPSRFVLSLISCPWIRRIFAFSRCSCGGNSRAKGTLIKVGGAMHLRRICHVLAMHRRIFPAGEKGRAGFVKWRTRICHFVVIFVTVIGSTR